MKEPIPFEPRWKATIDKAVRYGMGLLPNDLFPLKDTLDEFAVHLGDRELKVQPKAGLILDGLTLLFVGTPSSRLIWNRQMEMHYNTHDTSNQSRPNCLFYRLGLDNQMGGAFGFRIMPDLKAQLGNL